MSLKKGFVQFVCFLFKSRPLKKLFLKTKKEMIKGHERRESEEKRRLFVQFWENNSFSSYL